MLIDYARVSTQDQNPQLQHDALLQAGSEKIFTEKVWLLWAFSTRENSAFVSWRMVTRLLNTPQYRVEIVYFSRHINKRLRVATRESDYFRLFEWIEVSDTNEMNSFFAD